jgi:hypothetical protein
MIRHAGAISAVTIAIGLASVAIAPGASAAAAPRPLPNPCKTFSAQAADNVLGLSRRVHPREHLTSASGVKICLASHGGRRLGVQVTWHNPGGPGRGNRCYRESRLGPAGRVCVSTTKTHFSGLEFRKHGLYVVDAINITLGHRGQRLVRFAIPQYKALRA